jgi:hypothetical protein
LFVSEAGASPDDVAAKEISDLEERERLKIAIKAKAWIAEFEAKKAHDAMVAEHEQQLRFDKSQAEDAARQDRLRKEQQAQQMITSIQQTGINAGIGLLQLFGRKHKGAALAAIAITKGLAIAQTLAQTQTAAMLAYSSQLVPGDPTSVARAQLAYAKTQTQGKISAALIGALGLAQAAAVGSGSGGFGGIGGGDTSGPGGGGGNGGGQRDNQIVNIDLQGEVFGRDQVRGLIGQINDALDDGYTLRV